MKRQPTIRPPRLAEQLFDWYCKSASVEDIHGDMEELFQADLKRLSIRRAKLNYWIQVISLVASYAVRKRKRKSYAHSISYNTNHQAMIGSYFKIAWRTIGKNKVYSVINVLGLALGICACLILYTVTSHELTFDKFHVDGDRIVRIGVEQGKGENKHLCACVPAPAATAIREEISAGIETVTGYHQYRPKVNIPEGGHSPKKIDRNLSNAIIAEPSYFDVFTYDWLAGNPGALNEPFKTVLTERQAHNYFGSLPWDEIVGKEVIYDDSLRTTVVGIVKDWKDNTDFPFTDFISFNTIKSSFLKNDIHLDNWHDWRHSSIAFIKLNKGTSAASLQTQLSQLFRKYLGAEADSTLQITAMTQPLADLHIEGDFDHHENLFPTLVALTTLALFILVIAVINFINLSTAQSIRRVKEIGIRKVLGSFRQSLILQFLVETFVLTFLAVCLATLTVNPVLSSFAAYLPSPVTFNFGPASLLFLLFVTLGTSLLAGFYPAHVLSANSPAVSLKGTGAHKGSEKWFFRKGLIVFQFASSLFFIIAVLVMGRQIEFIRNKDRGFSTASIITFRTNWGDKSNNLRVLAEKIRSISGVERVAVQTVAPMGFIKLMSPFVYKGDTLIEMPVSMKAGNSDFIPLYQLRLLAGRNIAESDTLKEFVINEYYSKALGFKRPEQAVGELLSFEGKSFAIVGVVEDFHEQSFHEMIGPAVIGNFTQFEHSIGVKLSNASMMNNKTKDIQAKIEKEFKQLYPGEPFEPHLIEDEIGWMHDREQRLSTLMNTAMIITIFISCLGVFGLAMFTAQIKTKEIGIRKVMGATLANIVVIFCRDIMILILIAIAITSPIAWYFMNNWLLEFAYRIELTVWIFVLAGLAALCLGLATVSFHAVRAGMADPVKSLRTE
ncbi:MAG TPA: ABC transporter permease [Chryseolinea sp.]